MLAGALVCISFPLALRAGVPCGVMMRTTLSRSLSASLSLLLLGTVACGGSYPVPTAQLSSAEAAARSARELGAEKDPKAQLHLKLAEEQIAQGKGLIKEENNHRADMVLQRAGSDAELAVMLAKEKAAKEELEALQQKLSALKSGK